MCALARAARLDKSRPKMRVSAAASRSKCNYGNALCEPTHLNPLQDKHSLCGATRDGWLQSFGFKEGCSSLNSPSHLHIRPTQRHQASVGSVLLRAERFFLPTGTLTLGKKT